jgi:hypothetical protein
MTPYFSNKIFYPPLIEATYFIAPPPSTPILNSITLSQFRNHFFLPSYSVYFNIVNIENDSQVDNSDFIPERLLALKQKTYTSDLLLLIEKNTFVCGGSIILKRWQKRLSTTCRNRTCQRGPLC